MNGLTRPLNSVGLRELLRSLSLRASFTTSPLPHAKHSTPSCPTKPLDFSTASRTKRTSRRQHQARRNAELPEELSKNVVHLSCKSSAEGGKCDVYLVGTWHL
ncbi:hypothetical protein V6N12_000536 [Hibiscus sabdariffa]|uniref:Uncharacterized protein n=1 Tax=Hibiscus sabdariffa TaxID=183260 RepID=A0ABR2AK02_9ROSI